MNHSGNIRYLLFLILHCLLVAAQAGNFGCVSSFADRPTTHVLDPARATSSKKDQAVKTLAAAHDEIRARALVEFDQALYFKPRSGSGAGRVWDYAPLIVQQFRGSETGGPNSFTTLGMGMPMPAAEGEAPQPLGGNTDSLAVYSGVAHITINGVRYEQVMYLWWYRSEPQAASSHATAGQPRGPAAINPRMRGVRITLGADGFPIVWEALTNQYRDRLLFVSESAERAAHEVFGGPLTGRRFSIEASLEEAPDVLVVRLVADGPVPMGPYVYLSETGLAVTTMLCRCSPSQFRRTVQEVSYDLLPLDSLEPPLAAMVPNQADLNRILRWPPALERANEE